MLIITDKQMAEMNRRYNECYEAQAVRYLTDKYKDWSVEHGPERLRMFVSDGVKRAEHYRVNVPGDVTAFLEYSIRFGKDFERKEDYEWVMNILKTRNLSGTEKMSRIMEFHPL